MVGALWVIFRGDPARLVNLEVNIGDGIFLAGCVGYAVYSSLIKRLHRGEPVLIQTFWTMVAAALWLVAASNVMLWRTDWSGSRRWCWAVSSTSRSCRPSSPFS